MKQGAEIVGYIFDVKIGGFESTNCHARTAEQRDTHIDLVLDPMAGSPAQRVIVEVTPRWRAIMAAQGVDWSTRALRDRLLGMLDQGQGLDAVRRGTPECVREHGSGSRAQLESDCLGNSPSCITSIEVAQRPAR